MHGNLVSDHFTVPLIEVMVCLAVIPQSTKSIIKQFVFTHCKTLFSGKIKYI